MSDIKIITTEDGSHSLYNANLNETYHSFHGAIQESLHVFVEHGLNFIATKTLKVFEVGFGTGLNALLAALWAEKNQRKVIFDSIEAFPVNEEVIAGLNYSDRLEAENSGDLFDKIHSADWNKESEISDWFMQKKIHDQLEDTSLVENNYDVIFYDAFAPSKQSEMWQIEPLEKVIKSLKKGGCFVTYCAQGQLKRNLKSLGLEVETLPGPPGKKEMVRGVKG